MCALSALKGLRFSFVIGLLSGQIALGQIQPSSLTSALQNAEGVSTVRMAGRELQLGTKGDIQSILLFSPTDMSNIAWSRVYFGAPYGLWKKCHREQLLRSQVSISKPIVLNSRSTAQITAY